MGLGITSGDSFGGFALLLAQPVRLHAKVPTCRRGHKTSAVRLFFGGGILIQKSVSVFPNNVATVSSQSGPPNPSIAEACHMDYGAYHP